MPMTDRLAVRKLSQQLRGEDRDARLHDILKQVQNPLVMSKLFRLVGQHRQLIRKSFVFPRSLDRPFAPVKLFVNLS
ncbi:hypothetical protein D3C85_1849410 [compost metagenome]